MHEDDLEDALEESERKNTLLSFRDVNTSLRLSIGTSTLDGEYLILNDDESDAVINLLLKRSNAVLKRLGVSPTKSGGET